MTIRKILGNITNKGIKRVSGRVDVGTAGYDSIATGPGPSTLMVFSTPGAKTLTVYGSSNWTPSNQSRQIRSVVNPSAGNLPGPRSVELLVIGGGGGCGPAAIEGGGAGGVKYYGPTATPVRVSTTYTVPSSPSIPVVVGLGGSGQPGPSGSFPGQNSSFDTIVATGGGGGRNPGGSGGGGVSPLGSGGTGVPGQGFPGSAAGPYGGGGGGGATQAGQAPNPNSGPGGNGVQLTIFNPFGVPAPPGSNWFAGGGGGSSTPANFGNPQQGTGGFGGGGFCNYNGPNAVHPGNPGATNTGAGGGGSHGGNPPSGGNGGPGIVIIRY
jgi:hypothetical protein